MKCDNYKPYMSSFIVQLSSHTTFASCATDLLPNLVLTVIPAKGLMQHIIEKTAAHPLLEPVQGILFISPLTPSSLFHTLTHHLGSVASQLIVPAGVSHPGIQEESLRRRSQWTGTGPTTCPGKKLSNFAFILTVAARPSPISTVQGIKGIWNRSKIRFLFEMLLLKRRFSEIYGGG